MTPRSILLDRSSWHRLSYLRERRHHETIPREWHWFVDNLSMIHSGKSVEKFKLTHVFSKQHCLFSWQFSLATIIMAISGNGLVYLCWGLPNRTWWKNRLIKFLLKRAEHILVNDKITKQEVKMLTNMEAKIVPFFIDTDYFTYKPMTERLDFLFCPSSNDRDPKILLGLAQKGFKVIWLVNDKKLQQTYKNQHSNLVLISNISYDELRGLYQTCALVILPLLEDKHAAGQTTGLEAISCGAPVIISAGRSSTIFSNYRSVYIVQAHKLEIWTNYMNSLPQKMLTNFTKESSDRLSENISKLQTRLTHFLHKQSHV